MKILLFVFALWAFMYIAPSEGRDVTRHYGPKGTICKQGNHWIVKIKCTDKCKIGKPKAAFGKGRVSITGRVGNVFKQKKKTCGVNCFCTRRNKPKWNQVFCRRQQGKKIESDRVYFDIWCIKKTTKLRFKAYVRNIKPRMMGKKCATGETKHVDGICRKCENGKYENNLRVCTHCNCGTEGSKFQTCEDTSGQCDCKDGYKGRDCKTCEEKFYKITATGECKACGCGIHGSQNSGNCLENTGACTCKSDFKPPKCKECKDGLFPFADVCYSCGCITANTKGNKATCDASGQCDCIPGKSGKQCD